MTRRRALAGTAFLVLIVFTSVSAASASFRGSDMWSSIMPGSGTHGLVNRYPISYYQLDYHVDGPSAGLGGVSLGDPAASIAQFMASSLFLVAAYLMRFVIAIFDWSNSIDLITGNNGGLAQATPVVHHNYSTLAAPFLTIVIVCLGIWIAHKSIKRDAKNVVSVIARVLVMTAIAYAIVNHPQDTVGRIYQMGDDIAMAVIGGGDGTSVSDKLFETFIYRPHAVLQHGGLEVCTGAKLDDDGFPLAATSQNPARECHSVLKRDSDGHGDYEAIMMRYAPASKNRTAYYDALREGKPFSEAPTLKIDKTDAPAVDMMQAGGALQRFVFVILILFGMAGGILLLGLIVIARMFSQIALLFLYFASPFVILASVYPGSHGLATKYLSMLGKVLVSSAVFALLLSLTLNTSRGLSAAATAIDPSTGYGFAFGLQAILFLGVFVYRKAILKAATSSKTAKHFTESENHAKAFVGTAAVGAATAVSGGVGGIAGTMREGWKTGHGGSQEEATHMPDSTSPPASAGREHPPTPSGDSPAPSTAPVASSTDFPSSTSDSMSQPQTTEDDQMPTKSFREELADTRARNYDEQYQQSNGTEPSPQPAKPYRPVHPLPDVSGIASASTFSRDLENERHERELERRE